MPAHDGSLTVENAFSESQKPPRGVAHRLSYNAILPAAASATQRKRHRGTILRRAVASTENRAAGISAGGNATGKQLSAQETEIKDKK
jgi:hypothetical protein